jgi:hypothetical protein
LNQNRALDSCFDAFSSREPKSTSLENALKADGMDEKRKHPRTEIEEPAFVSSGGSVMRCVVRNISRDGAAIDVENPAFVPQAFRLVMARDSSIVRECRVAWIKRNRVGLTFVDVDGAAPSASGGDD